MTWALMDEYAVCMAPLPAEVLEGLAYQRVTIDGRSLTVVPHRWDTISRLRSRGLHAPSMAETYHWPGPWPPMRHQKATTAFLLDHPRAFVLSDPGTGKTASAIWAADILMKQQQVRRVLIVAPKSTLVSVWEKELFVLLRGAVYSTLEGSRERKRQVAADPRIRWIIVNPESLGIVADHLPGVDLVIVDEATRFKTWSAQRTRTLFRLGLDKRLWMMTGTPAPQQPTDAYALIKSVRRGKYMSERQFRDMTMLQVNQFRWVPKSEAPEIIAREMQPAVRYRREECVDLPEFLVVDRAVPLSPQQAKLVKTFQREAFADLEGKKITAANAAGALSKCLQVMAGGVYGDDSHGNVVGYSVDAEPLFETLRDIVEDAQGPVLVFAPFRVSAATIHLRMQAAGFRSAVIMAGTTPSQRADIFRDVQEGRLDVMVAIPQTVSHGLTLTASNTIVWVSPPMSFETYEQANARIYRKGQTRPCTAYRLVQNNLTQMLYKRLDTKATLQETILRLMEGRD